MKNQFNFKYSTFCLLFLLILQMSCTKDFIYVSGSIQDEANKAIDEGYDGVIVYVDKAGETSLYSAGWKDRANQIPADPNALFKIASISKLYIAVAATKLVANDSLSLDNTLSELIPETSGKIANANSITLRMMIQHRSGIPEYIYHPDFADRDPYEDYMATATLIFDQAADFGPNQDYKYSNTNYLLIGEILDRTLGYNHHEYIKNEILIPLDLENTYSASSAIDSSELMSGYYVGYEPDLKSIPSTRPGGAMMATAEDVGIFLRALINGTLLTAEEQEIYTSVYPYEHTGWVPGYTSIARYHDEMDAVVIQFVSTSKDELFWIGLERLYNRIVDAVEKEK